MNNNYKLVFTSDSMYREVSLKSTQQQWIIGTDLESDVRFREDDFLSPFSFSVVNYKDLWRIECEESVYVETRTQGKKIIVDLKEGEVYDVKYSANQFDLFQVSMELDFDIASKSYNTYVPIKDRERISIGTDPGCDIQLRGLAHSHGGFDLEKTINNTYSVRPRVTGNIPLMCNGIKITKEFAVEQLDFISFGAYCFCYYQDKLYYDNHDDIKLVSIAATPVYESNNAMVYPEFNRSTRIKEELNEEKIEVLDPSPKPSKPRNNIIIQLFPAIAMLLVTVLLRYILNTNGAQFLIISSCTMGIGVISSIMNIIQDRKNYKEDISHREQTYKNYIEAKRDYIKKAREEEQEILEHTYYALNEEWNMMAEFSSKLFERELQDQDFLDLRLGTGEREAVRKLDIKKRERLEDSDELMKLPEMLEEESRYMANVPVTLNLYRQSQIGIAGDKKQLLNLCKLMTVDITTRHFYSDVRLVYCIGEEEKESFDWLRFLPHIKNEELDRRNIICDEDSKNILFEYLYKLLTGDRTEESLPHFVVFVFRDWGIQTHPISKMMDQARSKGITFVLFNEKEELLHNKCDYIVRLNNDGCGQKIDSQDGTKIEKFEMPKVDDDKLLAFVRKLAPVYCKEINLEGTLTKSISFFEMLNIYDLRDINLERNWVTAEVWNSLAAPIGVKAKNQIVQLDLNEKAHGPHGLVAGTTGSGKSELLQTYILSIAIKYHPYDVAFMIIDFKGGGMANQFKTLPHLLGTITNIDGKEIDRSLQSLRAELKKREELFAEYKVNHIDAYIRLFRKGITKNPLPHLILVVDEFAELKMEQPDFMKELISTARVGRSLGVHLILATQKPSGVVDPQIWSNSRFKLCLKVQSREDSNEILKNPLAAEIREPGRAYLQIGNNEVLDLFQSAYSEALAKEDRQKGQESFVLSTVELSGKKKAVYENKVETYDSGNVTQLESVVEYVSAYFRQSGQRKLPIICLEPLPVNIAYPTHDKVCNAEQGYCAFIGIYDDPSRQKQEEISVNVTMKHTFIIGSAQNGKTNLLQTMLVSLTEQYTAEELNIYILDFGSMLFRNYEALKHVGGVVCSNEDEKLKNLFKMLGFEINRRKDVILKAGVGSFSAYMEAGYKKLPQIVVFIDNMTALRELYLMESDPLLPLIREGIGVGISFVIANLQTTGIGYKYLSNFENRIALYCNDSSEYSVLFEGCRKRPDNSPGRALIEMEKNIYEAQMYLTFDGNREIERVTKIQNYVKKRNQETPGQEAKGIPYVPQKVTERILREQFFPKAGNRNFAIGVDFDKVEPFYLNLIRDSVWAISGQEDSGSGIFVRWITTSLLKSGAKLYILDNPEGTMSFTRQQSSLYSQSLEDISELMTSLEMDCDIFSNQKEENIAVLLIHHPQAVECISKDNSLLSQYKTILAKSKNHPIIIIWTSIENVQITFSSPEVLKMMKEDRRLIIFENISDIKLADFTTMTKRRYSKDLILDEAFVIENNQIHKIKTITP